VVVRVAQPHQRRDQHAVGHGLAGAPDDLADQEAVREDGHVVPVLLERGHRHHHRDVARQVGDLGPGHVLQQHGCASSPRA
jgi:hypothetical protein